MRNRRLNRRRLIQTATASGTGIAATGASTSFPAFAQEGGTPVVEDSAVDSDTEQGTPVPERPTVPPEYEIETNWPVEGGNIHATRHARGTSISSETVSQLGVAWTLPVGVSAPFGALTGNPVVAGDTLYQQDAMSNVYALDKATGEQIWFNEYNNPVPSGGPNGVAVAYNMAVYPLGGAGEVIAADAATGDELWRTSIRGPLGEGITMAPMVFDNFVYISTIPGTPEEFYQGGQRGVIFALDARDGTIVWYFDTTTDNLWGNARVNSGGGLWHPPSIGEDGDLYVGVGNASPYPGTEEYPGGTSRPGPNDYANALMRIHPETASVDWYINVKPHDLFDHDNQLSPILATVNVDGADYPLAFSSGKHGYVVAAHQDSGDELWRTAVGDHNEYEFLEYLGPEEELGEQHDYEYVQYLGPDEQIELLPGFIGGVETPMAYSDGRIFVPVLNIPYLTDGVEGSGDVFDGASEFLALDAATGDVLWSVEIPATVLGGATVTNDVVFTGALDGVVRGYNVEDGTEVFTYQAPAGINTSFAVSGDYLYVPAGAPLVPSEATAEPAPELSQQLIAFRIGAEGQATPTG